MSGPLYSTAGLPDLSGQIDIVDTAPFAFGGFADIWRGKFKDQTSGALVAVKVIRTYTDDPEYVKERNDKLVREGKVWSQLSHPSITPFIGISFNVGHGQPGSPALVCPYYVNGNLVNYLESYPDANAIRLLAEAAEALAYLHSLEPHSIIHGDIKASNILVNDEGHVCLADFGLSRILEMRGFTTKSTGGSYRWLAYELVVASLEEEEELPPLTRASDTWAFGMTILQVKTGKVPYHTINFDPTVIFTLLKRELPQRPITFADGLWRILLHCWTLNPAGRPSMKAVAHALEAFNKNDGLTPAEIDDVLDEIA